MLTWLALESIEPGLRLAARPQLLVSQGPDPHRPWFPDVRADAQSQGSCGGAPRRGRIDCGVSLPGSFGASPEFPLTLQALGIVPTPALPVLYCMLCITRFVNTGSRRRRRSCFPSARLPCWQCITLIINASHHVVTPEIPGDGSRRRPKAAGLARVALREADQARLHQGAPWVRSHE